MNDNFAHHSANKLAARVMAGGADESARVVHLFQTALTRAPDADELRECEEFLKAYREKLAARSVPGGDVEAWSALARVVLSGNEFAFVD